MPDKKPQPLAIKYVPIDTLIPYARNSRTHSDVQVAQLAASIKEFGWTNPVIVDGDAGIIAGHGRVLAARKLGITEVPVVERNDMTPAQKKAYIIADNKLALNAGWDFDMLKVELGELQTEGFDLNMIGFSDKELNGIMGELRTGLTDADDAPPEPVNPVSRPGDLWILGKHRLLCGSSIVATDVERLLNGTKPLLMVTDPPYGVNYDPAWRNRVLREDGSRVAARATGKVMNDDKADWTEAWALFPGEVAYVWHGALHSGEVEKSLRDAGFNVRSQIIWDKTRLVIGRGDYHWQHEPCWYAVRKGGKGHWFGDRKQTTIWPIAHLKSETGHGTQKPVECMRKPIENNSSPGQIVYEPFSGSGTTIMAGEQVDRCVYAMELAEKYVDVAVMRWEAFTGEEAVLDGTGETFKATAKARGVKVPSVDLQVKEKKKPARAKP
jgi:DNA modification methylase